MIYLFTTTVKTFYIKQGGKQIMKGKYLKKWMSVFLSTALAISSISGCGNSDKEPTDSTDKSANETTDTANKDTASDEASDVQDGDTPLIGSWIDLSYGIQVKIEKDGTFVVWNDEQTAKGTYTYENNYLVMTSKDVQNEEKGYVKLSDDHFALFTSDSMILDYTTDCFVRNSAADKYDPAKDFSRYNQAWTIASGPDQFVINNETYDANELYIILTEGNRLRIGKPEKIGDSNYEVLTEGLIEFSDNYNKLEFIFSDPFTGQDGTDYRSELKDGQWIISPEGEIADNPQLVLSPL